MNNARGLVQVFDGVCHLANDMSTQIFAKVCQAHNLMEQFAPGAQFEDNVVVLASFRKVKQLDDVRVVNLAHDLDLFQDICSLRRYINSLLLEYKKQKARRHT